MKTLYYRMLSYLRMLLLNRKVKLVIRKSEEIGLEVTDNDMLKEIQGYHNYDYYIFDNNLIYLYKNFIEKDKYDRMKLLALGYEVYAFIKTDNEKIFHQYKYKIKNSDKNKIVEIKF